MSVYPAVPTPASVALLATGDLEALKAKAITRLRSNDGSQDAEWSRLLPFIDSELGKRRGTAQKARTGRSGASAEPDGPDLARRVVNAREDLYKEDTKAAIRKRADQVLRDMRGTV